MNTDHLFGRDYVEETTNSVVYHASNYTRRHHRWNKQSKLYRAIYFFPFHISDWIMFELEHSRHAYSCPWCDRTWFDPDDEKKCCEDIKKKYGPTPAVNIYAMVHSGGGGGYGGTYDRVSSNTIKDESGFTYGRRS